MTTALHQQMFVFVELGEFFVVIGGQLFQHLDIFSSLDCQVFGGCWDELAAH